MSEKLLNEAFALSGIAYSRLVLAGRIALIASGEHGNVATTVVTSKEMGVERVHLILVLVEIAVGVTKAI